LLLGRRHEIILLKKKPDGALIDRSGMGARGDLPQAGTSTPTGPYVHAIGSTHRKSGISRQARASGRLIQIFLTDIEFHAGFFRHP
jgi:hypothetical protein